MKLLADTLAKQITKTDLSNGLAFFMADYEKILLDAPQTPQKQSIISLLGKSAVFWSEFNQHTSELGLTSELTINPYVFPNWTAKILIGKKLFVPFILTGTSF